MTKAHKSPKKLAKTLLPPQKHIRIFTEGLVTEIKYFQGIFKDRRLTGAKAEKPKDHSPLGLVDAAIEAKKLAIKNKIALADICIWVVFDKDQHANIPQAINKARANNINIAFSNICFEFWVLLHYDRTTAPSAPCDDVIRLIKTHNPQYSKEQSYDVYGVLSPLMNNARNHAAWVQQQVIQNHPTGTPIWDINPYTDVHELVEFLLSV